MKTDNELIAEFMGWNKDAVGLWLIPEGYAMRIRIRLFSTDNLIFDTSWDWLMPVVEKIERLGNRCEIGIVKCKIYSADYNREIFYASTKILAVYNHVVDFIKWYNQNK